MSAPMPNPFDYNSADAAECEAVAHASPPSTATANLSVPMVQPTDATGKAVIDSCQEPVAADLKEDDLYWSLRRADDPFERDLPEIPNPRALFNAIKGDPVWSDPAPMFLKMEA